MKTIEALAGRCSMSPEELVWLGLDVYLRFCDIQISSPWCDCWQRARELAFKQAERRLSQKKADRAMRSIKPITSRPAVKCQ